MIYFTCDIHDWVSWSKVFQDIKAWKPLIEYILRLEDLPYADIEHLTPGTNAVFRSGDYVVKIFAPIESGMDMYSDFSTEKFGLVRSESLEVSVPRLERSGIIHDKYEFMYMVMEYVDAEELVKAEESFSDLQKEEIGRKLRKICDRMNTPCEDFDNIDVIKRAIKAKRWSKFADRFQQERMDWLYKYKEEEKVFVHGDLNPDNILIDKDMNIYIIDFADSIQAPYEYELAALLCETFEFEYPYMKGFFGADYDVSDIANKILQALLMHDFGENIIKNNFGEPEEITGLSDLHNRIYSAISNKKISENGKCD